jgi:hypothetical protein
MVAAPSSDSGSSSGSGLLGQTILDELTPPADVNTSDTGENRLKKVQPVVDALKSLAPLYTKWKACAVSQNMTTSAGCWNDQDVYGAGVESTQMPLMNTINFGALYSPYSRMSQMHSAGQALQTIASSASGALPQYWTGKAADAAGTKLGDLQYASQEYTQTLESLSPHVMGLWTATTNAVQKLADFVDTADGKAIVQAGKDNTGKGQDLGHDMTLDACGSYIDQMNLAVKNGLYEGWNPEPSSSPSDNTVSAEQLRNPGICELDGGHGSWWSNESATWFDKFGDIYHSAVKAFRTQITASYNAVDQALGDFNGQIASIPSDPFGKLQAPGQPAPSQTGGSGPSGSGTPNGSGTPTPSAGGSHNGGASPSGGTSAASFTPPPTSPSTVGAGGGSPTGTVNPSSPNGTPTGMPTIPPTSPTGSPTGTPVGTPVGTTTTQGAGESMTVQSGKNQISMTSPDSHGNVQLSVNNGSGTQSYNIGFGQGTGSATPGTPGSATPGTPGHGAVPATQGQVPGQGVPQQITPGANGAAVIHDGNLTITTTEPHGHGGPVQVTVDDGSGHPSAYTLNPGSGAAAGTPMQPLSGTTPAGAYTGTPDSSGYAIPAGQSAQPYGGAPSGGAYPTGTPYDPSSTAAAASYQPDPSTQSAAWLPPGGDPSSHAAAASGFAQHLGGGVGGGSPTPAHLGGGAVGGPVDHTSGMASPVAGSGHDVSGVGLANTNVSNPGAPGGAGMAAGPGAAGGQTGSGGAPMMGGMGGMGGGGSQGGDQERGASQWRVRGDLFGDVSGTLEVPRVIGEDEQ